MGDRWGEKQSVVIPEINKKFIGFKIEMLFNYKHDQGLSWCHGEVIAIKDAKKKTVIVRLLGKERNLKQFKKEQVSGGGVAGVFNRIIDFIL